MASRWPSSKIYSHMRPTSNFSNILNASDEYDLCNRAATKVSQYITFTVFMDFAYITHQSPTDCLQQKLKPKIKHCNSLKQTKDATYFMHYTNN